MQLVILARDGAGLVTLVMAGQVGGGGGAAILRPGLGGAFGRRQLAGVADVFAEGKGRVGQCDMVLGTFRTRDGGDDIALIQFQRRGIDRRVILARQKPLPLA